MTVRPLGAARIDIVDIADWYDLQSIGLGDRFLEAIDFTVDQISRFPRFGWRALRAPHGREVRETLVDGFPFVLAYEVCPTELVVLSVTHWRRKRQLWRRRI